MFFVELKPAPYDDTYKVEYLQQRKIKFEPPKHKRAQCAVNGMATLKQEASNVTVIIRQSSANVKKD
jgi:hypothetical protein